METNPPSVWHEHNPWLLWQVIDSAFPVGGFAHSAGLESAVQLGRVQDGRLLSEFVELSLRQTARLAGPFALAVRDDPSRFTELDALYHAMLSSTVPNRASKAQGQALLVTASQIVPASGMESARQRLRESTVHAHLPVVFGLLAHAVRIDRPTTADAMLFVQMRSILSAAVRMNVVGPIEAQQIQLAMGALRSRLQQAMLNTPLDQAAGIAPALDLLHAQHDRLYSRLFSS